MSSLLCRLTVVPPSRRFISGVPFALSFNGIFLQVEQINALSLFSFIWRTIQLNRITTLRLLFVILSTRNKTFNHNSALPLLNFRLSRKLTKDQPNKQVKKYQIRQYDLHFCKPFLLMKRLRKLPSNNKQAQ